MLRFHLLAAAVLAAAAPGALAQGKNWHAFPIQLTTLGSYVPELESTLVVMTKHVTDTANEDRTIANVAWQALAFSGMGSGMRGGRHKKPLKTLVRWLARQQTSFHEQPDSPRPSRTDSILLSLTFARSRIENDYKVLIRYIRWSLEMWLADAGKNNTPPFSGDETVLLALLAQALGETQFKDEHQQVLALATRASEATPFGKTRRADAVHYCVARAAGKSHQPELKAATCWPGNELADPLHTWLAAFSLRSLPPAVRAPLQDRCKQLIDKREKDHLWPAAGNFDRLTTSAMLVAAIGMTASNTSPPRAAPAQEKLQKSDPWNGPIK
jgi:hypothetical protein